MTLSTPSFVRQFFTSEEDSRHATNELKTREIIFAKEKIQQHLQSNIKRLNNTTKNVSKNTSIPVAICDDSLWNFLPNCSSSVVLLSKETLEKLTRKHNEVINNNNCLSSIQHFIDNGLTIIEGRNNYTHVLLFLDQICINNKLKWFKLAIKLTRNGNEIFLTSFHQIEDYTYNSIIKNGTIIKQRKTLLSCHLRKQFSLRILGHRSVNVDILTRHMTNKNINIFCLVISICVLLAVIAFCCEQ